MKVGNNQPQVQPEMTEMPQAEMPMDNGQMQDPFMMGGDPNALGQEEQMPDPNQGQSQFDTNFDAGVEADEDQDPKKYIQQLTGKLSTTLSTYNNDGEPDEGLNKYVAKMINAQTSKYLSDSAKDDVISAINKAQEDSENPEEVDAEENPDVDEPEMENPEGEGMEEPMEPVNEMVYNMKELRKLMEAIGTETREPDTEEIRTVKDKKAKISKNNPFEPKKFN